jgi:hypothetical protein
MTPSLLKMPLHGDTFAYLRPYLPTSQTLTQLQSFPNVYKDVFCVV